MARRLTTILAADVAGFSRLVGADEEGTLAELRDHRTELLDPLIDGFGGRVANTAGDSLLIEFPSAVEAVRCAVAMQEGMAQRTADRPGDRRIRFRMGINVGDVLSEGDDLLGDGVNIAARLEGLAPPGGILLSRSARDQVRDRLELDLADLGEVAVKNIARPVRAFQVLLAGEAPLKVPPAPGRRKLVLAAVAAVLLCVVAGGGLWYGWLGSDPAGGSASSALAEKPSIVVRPFANLSGDAELDYFVEGFATAVRAQLSKFPQVFVIAGASSGNSDGPTTRARDVARELGVRYILDGSLQRGAEAFTVNTELIEAESEQTIWAEQYHFKSKDPFSTQAELIQEVAGTLRFAMEEQQLLSLRRRPTENPSAYDFYLQAISAKNRLTKEGRIEATRLLNLAVELDPDFLDAHFELSGRYLSLWRFGGAEDPEEALRLARLHAERALQINSNDYRGHYRTGMLHLFADHEFELAYASYRRALELNPNDADVLYDMGFLRSLMGEGQEAIEWNNKAKRVNPRYPAWYEFNAALSHFLVKDYEQALLLARTGMAAYPRSLAPRRILIATLVEMGRLDEARKQVADYLAIRPEFRLSTFRNTPFQNSADQERYFGALRTAGIPD